MSEFRQDRTNGAWVIVAPERGRRPSQRQACDDATAVSPAYDPLCPFCPGNEHMLPGIIEETASEQPPGWRLRVVPNKYPVVRPGEGASPSAAGTHALAVGYGYHEVIIETPRHDADLTTLSESGMTTVVRSYHRRYVELIGLPAINAVIVFRNQGRGAGASVAHPHSQVIATSLVPPRLAATSAWARSHHGRRGRCVICEEIELELVDGRRIVEAGEQFLVVVPFAAASPFEQRILPRRHRASFAQCGVGELFELGNALKRALRRLQAVAGDPPYNLVVEPALKDDGAAPFSHWGVRIVPELVTPGGFELGAGLPINPSRPEDDAEALRTAPVPVREHAT